MALPPGLAKFMESKKGGVSPLQQAAAARLSQSSKPSGNASRFKKKKKTAVKMVPDTDMDGM